MVKRILLPIAWDANARTAVVGRTSPLADAASPNLCELQTAVPSVDLPNGADAFSPGRLFCESGL